MCSNSSETNSSKTNRSTLNSSNINNRETHSGIAGRPPPAPEAPSPMCLRGRPQPRNPRP
eukprot:4923006-Heterocapsa_arctica.AAC.1